MAQRLMDRVKARRDSEGGFTLIELLVVIIILGILAAVVVFSVSGIDKRGKEAACSIDERTLLTAAEAYYAQETDYPDDATPWLNPPDGVNALTGNKGPGTDIGDLLVPEFLSEASTYHDLLIYDNDPTAAVDERLIAVQTNPADCAD